MKTDCFKILFKNVTFANRRTLPQIHSSKGVRASKMLMSVVKNVYIEFYFCKIISSKYRTAVLVKTWLPVTKYYGNCLSNAGNLAQWLAET